MNNIPFIFFGTPYVARDTLEVLSSRGLTPKIVVTSPDKPAGRGMHVQPSPVKVWTEEHNVSLLQPEKIDEEFIQKVKESGCDVAIVVAYGKILPESLISACPKGTLNIHYSLLPKYRGASPVESALLRGDEVTGVTIQKMVHKLDAGYIIRMDEVDIRPDDTTTTLRARLIEIGAHLLADTLPDYVGDKITPIAQEETQATRAEKMKKEDGDITNETNDRVKWNKYRAFVEWPRTYFFENGKRTIISDATFENGKFVIKKVIPEGKKETAFKTFNDQ